jgi:MinD superfamily P-loop ATPase
VDAPDLHLLLEPKVFESHVFEGNWIASIDAEQCNACGICMEYCRFDAIRTNGSEIPAIDPFKCEGCRLCERICPVQAISSERSKNNHWYVSGTRHGTMVHARMGPGEENSGKLVTRVRQKAKELAQLEMAAFILTDGPPGTGCPAIAAVSGTDLVVLVMEPSRSSLHDAKRVADLLGQMNIKAVAIINKYDLHTPITREIEQFLENEGIPLAGKIPFDEQVVEAMIRSKSVIEYAPRSKASAALAGIWEHIDQQLQKP